MALEIVMNQYFVSEIQTKEIHDSPTIGASLTAMVNDKEYGPYPSKSDAYKKIALLKLERLSEGYKKSATGKNTLFKDDFDICYRVRRGTVPF